MHTMQSTILLQNARIKAQDARIQNQDARTEAQDAHIKAQDAKIAQQGARLAQLEKEVRQMKDDSGKEMTDTNHGLQSHQDTTLGFVNNSLPNESTKFRRNMQGEKELIVKIHIVDYL